MDTDSITKSLGLFVAPVFRIGPPGHYCVRIIGICLNTIRRKQRLPRTQLGVERAAVLKLGSLRESSKPLTTKENRREETVPYS